MLNNNNQKDRKYNIPDNQDTNNNYFTAVKFSASVR